MYVVLVRRIDCVHRLPVRLRCRRKHGRFHRLSTRQTQDIDLVSFPGKRQGRWIFLISHVQTIRDFGQRVAVVDGWKVSPDSM